MTILVGMSQMKDIAIRETAYCRFKLFTVFVQNAKISCTKLPVFKPDK